MKVGATPNAKLVVTEVVTAPAKQAVKARVVNVPRVKTVQAAHKATAPMATMTTPQKTVQVNLQLWQPMQSCRWMPHPACRSSRVTSNALSAPMADAPVAKAVRVVSPVLKEKHVLMPAPKAVASAVRAATVRRV